MYPRHCVATSIYLFVHAKFIKIPLPRGHMVYIHPCFLVWAFLIRITTTWVYLCISVILPISLYGVYAYVLIHHAWCMMYDVGYFTFYWACFADGYTTTCIYYLPCASRLCSCIKRVLKIIEQIEIPWWLMSVWDEVWKI